MFVLQPPDAVTNIVGGSGFIGTRLAERLLRHGAALTIIDKAPSARFPEFHRLGDISDLDSLRATMSGDPLVNLAPSTVTMCGHCRSTGT